MKAHVHCDLIKAWADGALIEFFDASNNMWFDIDEPTWYPEVHYRVKPSWSHYIPEQGLLCWVSDSSETEKTKIAVICNYFENNTYFKYSSSTRICFKYATPLSKEEVVKFLLPQTGKVSEFRCGSEQLKRRVSVARADCKLTLLPH